LRRGGERKSKSKRRGFEERSLKNQEEIDICHTPIFDLRLYSGGVSLINGGT